MVPSADIYRSSIFIQPRGLLSDPKLSTDVRLKYSGRMSAKSDEKGPQSSTRWREDIHVTVSFDLLEAQQAGTSLYDVNYTIFLVRFQACRRLILDSLFEHITPSILLDTLEPGC